MLLSLGMRMIQNAALAFIGISAGGVIAAGVFAFLVSIGVFPLLIGKTGTKEHIMLYGSVIVAGGVLGNLVDLYEFPIPLFGLSSLFLGTFGMAVGIFVGCLVILGNIKGTAGHQPPALSSGGAAVSDSVDRTGKACRGTDVFFVRDVCRMNQKGEYCFEIRCCLHNACLNRT